MKRTALVVAVAAVAATPLAAQHGHHANPLPPRPDPAVTAPTVRPMGMPGGMGMRMPGMDSMMLTCPMMGRGAMTGVGSMAGMDSMMGPPHAVMAYAPQLLLERSAALGLDADQESRLTRIAAAGQVVHDSAHAAASNHRRAFQDALGAPDPAAAAASHFEAMHASMGAAHAALLRAALAARAALTPRQRNLVEAEAHNHGGGR